LIQSFEPFHPVGSSDFQSPVFDWVDKILSSVRGATLLIAEIV
jgi:hypothetical protein